MKCKKLKPERRKKVEDKKTARCGGPRTDLSTRERGDPELQEV